MLNMLNMLLFETLMIYHRKIGKSNKLSKVSKVFLINARHGVYVCVDAGVGLVLKGWRHFLTKVKLAAPAGATSARLRDKIRTRFPSTFFLAIFSR